MVVFSKQMHMYVVWFWYSMGLYGMNYVLTNENENYFLTIAGKPTKEKFIVIHSPSAAGWVIKKRK